MADEKMCVDAEEVARDWGVSKSQAYKIIQRSYYNRCCLANAGGWIEKE